MHEQECHFGQYQNLAQSVKSMSHKGSLCRRPRIWSNHPPTLHNGSMARFRVMRCAPSHSLADMERQSLFSPYMYYHTPLPLNLVNKQASNKQASNKQHFSFPLRPLLRSTASDSTLLYPSHTLGGAPAESKF